MHDVFENRVRFAETDQQGVVFYGEYVTYQDEAVNAYLRAIDYDYDAMLAADWDVHVAHVDLDYRAPARFGDVIVNALGVESIGESSIRFAYRARRKRDDAVLAEGGVVHVAVDEDGKATRVPDDFRDAVVAFQDEPPEQ
ncbi:acyl-CoA thioesterase [Halomarina halobia]|uniref:Acyl-CoA thioesterase n=1 Tax=Halomarina halobia TaxID=3033386 RepID=A0ABD6AAC6_9EURY|nr:thioesterase family protein [Halomarina sp. PSR21]